MDPMHVLIIVATLFVVTRSVPVSQPLKDCSECQGAKKDHKYPSALRGKTQKFCGVKDDMQLTQGSKRSKRYILRGLQWNKKLITWRLKNFTPALNPIYTLETLQKVFRQWEMHSGITIKQVFEGNADIVISFEPKIHNVHGDVLCNMPFDGPGGTIGHAFYPLKNAVYAGNIHMDRDEEYSTDGSFGFNFESAIMHEIGHSLGLMHSNVYNAVMNPDYAMSAKGTNIQLTYDDIEGIQELYGPPETKERAENGIGDQNSVEYEQENALPTKAVPNNPPPSSMVTEKPKVATPPEATNQVDEDGDNSIADGEEENEEEDTNIVDNHIEIQAKSKAKSEAASTNPVTTLRDMTTDAQATTTALKDTSTKATTAAPNVSSSDKELVLQSAGLNKAKCPESFDGIYVSNIDSQTYVFNKFFEYSLGSWLGYKGASISIRSKFIFPDIDAIYRRVTDNKLIIFSNQLYAVYNEAENLERYGAIYDFGFPYNIRKIDAALIFGRRRNTYFFVGDEYWRYNERYKSMDPGYPKKIRDVWKGVPSNVDAAITWRNGMTYFFKGPNYYRVHQRTAGVEYGYPKSISQVWSRCQRYENRNS